MKGRRDISLRARVASGLVLAGLAGCSGPIVTEPDSPAAAARPGIAYFLPTARVLVTVSLVSGSLTLEIGQPILMADSSAAYRLALRPSIAANEKIAVQVTPTGLLSKIDTQSDGQLDEAIVAAVKSAAVIESQLVRDERAIFATLIDPERLANDPVALDALNRNLGAAVRRVARQQGTSAAVRSLAADPSPLTLRIERLFAPPAPDRAPVDCSVGFCYRRNVLYEVVVHAADGGTAVALVAVPNGSPTYAAPIERGLFTTWHTRATLENGVLTGFERDTGAELVAAATLPASAVGALAAGITQRGALFNSRTSLLEAEAKLIEARANLRDRQREDRLSIESNLRGDDTPPQLLSLTVGPVVARPQQASNEPRDHGSPGD